MTKTYILPGKRSPFVKAGTAFAGLDGIALSTPIVQAMSKHARPDFIVWGQVIPSPTISNLARELTLEAGLDPTIPAFSTQLACSTSMMAAIQASGILGRGGAHAALVGGVETMSRVPKLLKRHGLHLDDIATSEIHEAFAAQVLANIQAMTDPKYQIEHIGVSAEMGPFPFDRLDLNGCSLAIGHPFAATGARILSQTAKSLTDHPSGSLAPISICADGGQGAAMPLRHP